MLSVVIVFDSNPSSLSLLDFLIFVIPKPSSMRGSQRLKEFCFAAEFASLCAAETTTLQILLFFEINFQSIKVKFQTTHVFSKLKIYLSEIIRLHSTWNARLCFGFQTIKFGQRFQRMVKSKIWSVVVSAVQSEANSAAKQTPSNAANPASRTALESQKLGNRVKTAKKDLSRRRWLLRALLIRNSPWVSVL